VERCSRRHLPVTNNLRTPFWRMLTVFRLGHQPSHR
jgi:hypothetical protein